MGQRQAALHAEASHARLASQIRLGLAAIQSARLAIAARILVRQVRAMVARAT